MAAKPLDLVNLDFDAIIQSLRTYYETDPTYNGYNFAGSGLTQILNILANNTSINAYLANATINEAFLDSAIKRGNAISRAKENNYVPTSASSAMAIVNIQIPSPVDTSASITLDQYTPFTTNLSTGSFIFYNRESQVAYPVDGTYTFNNVELYEGDVVTNSFTVTANASVTDTTFTLPNSNIDVASIRLYVQNSVSDTTITPWNFTDDMTNVNGSSLVYYVQCNAQELYQIQFGDGVLGAVPAIGNIVIVTYQVCNTTAPNTVSTYAQTFSTQSIAGNTGLLINTVQNSIGGADVETIDEIKFNAPLAASANNRAVTEADYYYIIKKYASTVKSVNVYGGEKANPPVYGKIFITLEPQTGYFIPETMKTIIANDIIASRNMLTIIPEFIDPDYTFLTFTTSVVYDDTLTTLSSSDIQSAVQTTIQNYINTTLGNFNQNFYFSKLSSAIDATNASILGNTTSFNLQKRFSVAYGQALYLSCDFNSAISQGTVKSNSFTYYSNGALVTCILTDDSKGNLVITKQSDNSVVVPVIGTVNYSTGLVTVTNFTINSITGIQGQLKISASPVIEVSNVLTTNNQILLLDDSSLSVSDNVTAGITVTAAPFTQGA